MATKRRFWTSHSQAGAARNLFGGIDPAFSIPTGEHPSERLPKNNNRKIERMVVLNAVQEYPGQTRMELAGVTLLDPDILVARLKDLAEHGLVVRGRSRWCLVLSGPSPVWWPMTTKEEEDD